MKKTNILIWVGLIVNFFMLGASWYFYSIYPKGSDMYYTLSFDERSIADASVFFLKPFCISIILQVISIFILASFPKVGVAFAVIGSIIMLPLSLIFLVGYFRSYSSRIFEKLTPYNNASPKLSLTFKTSQFYMVGILFIILGVIALFMGLPIGGVFFILGIFYLTNAIRLKNKPLIGIEEDNLILTPSLYSKTYSFPLKSVSLIKDNHRMFKLHINFSGIDKKCSYNKNVIQEGNYSKKLESIFSQIKTESH